VAAINQENRPFVGITALIAGLLVFSLQDVIIKLFSAEYSILQIVIVRSVIALGLIGIIVAMRLGRSGFRVYQPFKIVLKGILGFLSYLAYYLSLASLPLIDAVTITFTAPILVVIFSSILVGERVGLRRWLATLAGFVGVLIAVGFEGRLANIAIAFAFLAALTYALNSVMARYISSRDNPWTVTFYFTVAHSAGGVITYLIVLLTAAGLDSTHPSLAFLFRDWTRPDITDLVIMCSLGVIATIGFFCLNKAYLSARAATVAPFEYSYILWAALFGYLIWGEAPTALTVIGLSILIGSNLFALRTEVKDAGTQA
jgi:drug/metabolite transporter (DMT)-like permease